MNKKILLIVITAFLLQACMRQVNVKNDTDRITLMVYMAADNDLESYALMNLKEMEKAASNKVKTLVLLDRSEGFDETDGNWTDTRLLEVLPGSAGSLRLDCPALGLSSDFQTELDMSNYTVLKNFVEYAKAAYPARHYVLIIWGHGTGWRYGEAAGDCPQVNRAVAIDDKTQSYMSLHNLGLALKDQGLDLIGFDTCFGGTFENVYELKDCASYTVASPGLTPGAGWDYKNLLEEMNKCNYASASSGMELAQCMQKASAAKATIFDNSRLDSVMKDLEDFARELASTITDSQSRQEVLDSLLECKSYSYVQFPCDMYLDIFSMAQSFALDSRPELAAAAEKLRMETAGLETGLYFIPRLSYFTMAVSHSTAYLKDDAQNDQCSFVKQSSWWVPTISGNSGSLLDKLFYTVF